MPFDLFISHAASFDKIDKSGLFTRAHKAITAEQFTGIFSRLKSATRPDGDMWVRHPEDDSPWLAARLTPKGTIVLSCSYTCHRYIRNFVDAFDLGVKIAEALEASLFEEVRGRRVSTPDLDSLLESEGEYVQLQAKTFAMAIQSMDEDSRAPLEYPLGPMDVIQEYFVLHLTLPAGGPTTLKGLLERLKFAQPLDQGETAALLPASNGKPGAKMLLRPDGMVQIWPAHGYVSFAESTAACFALLSALEAVFSGAPAAFFRVPLSAPERAELQQRAQGLGVEFFEWVRQWQQSRGQPS
jgi:hypothetical protein